MTSALSYVPTTSKIRSCVSLSDKLYMVSDLFMLFLSYPFYHMKVTRALPALLYMAMKDYKVRAGGLVFVVPGNCPPENTLMNEDYEPNVRGIISAFHGGVFVDVGAGIGLYTLIASKNVNKVVCLEPDVWAFKRLEASIKENGLENVKAYKVGAWHKAGTMKLHSHPFIRFQSSLKEDSGPAKFSSHFEEVLTLEVDSVIPLGSPVLIKLDVEGAEPEAMVGCLKTLLRKDVTVIFEALSEDALARSKRVIEPLGYGVTRLSERDYLARRELRRES